VTSRVSYLDPYDIVRDRLCAADAPLLRQTIITLILLSRQILPGVRAVDTLGARPLLSSFNEALVRRSKRGKDVAWRGGNGEWTLFVPPCSKSREINADYRLYFCPARWSRHKARYLGIYYDKAVRHIGTIAKVVECEIKDGKVVSENPLLTDDERRRIAAAAAAVKDQWDIRRKFQFFLCDDMCQTQFSKSSRGGMQGHRYFDLRNYFPGGIPVHLAEIAARLRSHQWE
jgi:hypothetical protein